MHGLPSEHGYRSPGWPLMVRLLDIAGPPPVARASSITAFTSPLNQDPANKFFFNLKSQMYNLERRSETFDWKFSFLNKQ